MSSHDDVLLAVFRYKHQRPSTVQTEGFCVQLRDALDACVEKLLQDGDCIDEAIAPTVAIHLDTQYDDHATPLDQFSAQDRAWLGRGWPQLCNVSTTTPPVGTVWVMTWFPAYASVLQAEQVGAETMGLRVIALDNWELTRHFLATGECVHSAISTKHIVLACGTIENELIPAFQEQLESTLTTAAQVRGSQRSAGNNEANMGHQKTPQFLVAAIRTAIDKVAETPGSGNHQPRGGMTDVGRHTGGEPRDTCWALVCAALQQALPPSTVLMHKIRLVFSASLLERELRCVDQRDDRTMSVFWNQVDKCVEMLDHIAVSVIALVENGYDGVGWLTKCQQWRAVLDNEVNKWNEHNAKRFRLPKLQHYDEDDPRQYPKLNAPRQQLFETLKGGTALWTTESCAAMAKPFTFIDSDLCSPPDLLRFLNAVTPHEDARVAFGRRAIEKRLLAISSRLVGSSLDDEWDTADPELLLQFVTWYGNHQVMHFYGDESRRLEQQSMMTVLTWIVFCCAHRFCTNKYKEARNFQVVLDWKRLDVCVLRERSARQAILCIGAYIRDWNQHVSGPPLFDPLDHSGTMTLAHEFGKSCHEDVYVKVQDEWKAACESTWLKIAQRKEEVETLRQEIVTHKADLWRTRQQLADEEARLLREWTDNNWTVSRRSRSRLRNWQTGQYKNEIKRLQSTIRRKNDKRDSLRRMPEFLISPLPFDQSNALQVLSLIAPPKELDVLAELCWRAQRCLSTTSSPASLNPGKTTWQAHFERYSHVRLQEPARYMIAYPGLLSVPTSFGPVSIDDVQSIEAFVGSNSWFPDIANSRVHWQDSSPGGSGRWINPFSVDATTSRNLFSPRILHAEGKDWKWAFEYPIMDALQRGNCIYAHWGQRFGGDEAQLGFCELGGLRAYPIQQLRRVFGSVEADSLTWSNPIVAGLIRQALYQVGEIDGTHLSQRLMWHEDLEDDASVDQFCAIVGRLVEDLDHSPRRWESLPLVAEVVGFLCQYNQAAKPLVRKLSCMAQRWAKDASLLQQREEITITERTELRTRECVLYGYAALCYHHYGMRAMENEDIEDVCGSVVQFHHAKLFVTQNIAMVNAIDSKISEMMADRVTYIVKALHSQMNYDSLESAVSVAREMGTGQTPCIVSSLQPTCEDSSLLTRLCHHINSTVPDGLSWHKIGEDDDQCYTSCFMTTFDASETRYLLNVFTGALETNGNFPCVLPSSIRQMPLYRKLFGDLEFEVTKSMDVYSTMTTNCKSLKYQFRVDNVSGELLVEEHSPGVKLQLCSQDWCQQFAAAFPRRLSEMYVPWYWLDQRVVFLRHPRVKEAQVYFVVSFEGTNCAHCYEVPRQDWGISYHELVSRTSQYPVFIVADTDLVGIFDKFEASQFVHITRRPRPQARLEISLPRFGLQFQENDEGRLVSLNHQGFILSSEQQLGSGQMPRFSQYLVLVDNDNEGVGNRRRLLIPTGQLDPNSSTGPVKIQVPSDSSALITCSAIDEHPRLKVFSPDTIDAQLQLASIYAASGSLLPWKDLGMTGGEAAFRLLRGCIPSRPFSAFATQQLETIAKFFAYRTPVLRLRVALLFVKSNRLGFLFDTEQRVSVAADDALDEYRYKQSSSSGARIYPWRQCLSRGEEWDLFGSIGASETIHARPSLGRCNETACSVEDNFPVDPSFVRVIELELMSFRTSTRNGSMFGSNETQTIPEFPLSVDTSNAMGMQMTNELRKSWEVFHRHDSTLMLTLPTEEFLERIRCLLSSVRTTREKCSAYLKRTVDMARNSVTDQLVEVVGRFTGPQINDIMQSVLDENIILQLAPRIQPLAREQWKRNCLYLLELCVLEDKLERVIGSTSDTQLLDELQTIHCPWDSKEHPYWLVFEVEGRLQIRHEQYVIAKHLIDQPGSICQLNMGRGKTRVILPMLFLYYSFKSRQQLSGQQLVRAHFLSPLLSETRDFMWRVLTAGILQLPFVEMPFNRNISLGRHELRVMQQVLRESTRNGAVVMVAPEHRLSLELKRVELGSLVESDHPPANLRVLDDVLDPCRYVDIFDESDALLNHGYHLVYAVGTSAALDGGFSRWLTAEALLRVLISEKSVRIQHLLRRSPGLWSFRPEYLERSGGQSGGGIFNGFQLSINSSSSQDDNDDDRSAFRLALLEDLMDNAPFDLEELRVFSADQDMRSAMLQLMTNVAVDANEAMNAMPPPILNIKHQVLALRGLVSCGVLENCLQKRYRVNYGHPPVGSRPKAIAIPFRAADLPAERSEFSHPDVGIVLSLLSFYHSGLTEHQLRRAFDILLTLDVSESFRYYSEWYQSIARSINNPQERQMLENLTHISLDNAHQFETVYTTYRYAIEVINFYVNCCVFPNDTRQFPSRLSRTAWDLVGGPHNVGFSGTNDTHPLLPLAVIQREPDEPVLRGTNGKMIQLLLDSTRNYHVLDSVDDEGKGATLGQVRMPSRACWQSLLILAVEKTCDALIDTGALLAGVSNHEAAQFLMTLPGFSQQGVTYYDTRSSYDGWVVYVKARDLVHPLKSSSLRERDTFVIFDEARSRGSDMKLRPQAIALLTLGPTITKDKFMQGAGRLRQLGKHRQTLELVSTPDVYRSVARQKKANGTTDPVSVEMKDVLSWVVDNTQWQCTFGFLEWAQSGTQYHAKEVDKACELQTDDWTLEGQYAGAQRELFISEVIENKVAKRMESIVSLSQPLVEHASVSVPSIVLDKSSTAFHEIRENGKRFGSQDIVCVTSLGNDECERELQIEEEQQEVRECVSYAVSPCTETIWNWRLLLDADSAHDLGELDLVSLEDAAKAWLQPCECRDIDWAHTRIFGTKNFWSTVKGQMHTDSLLWTSSLRRIQGIVYFGDGTVLLLTELEEDAVLRMLFYERLRLHTKMTHCGSFALVQLSFVVGYLNRITSTIDAMSLRVPISLLPLALGWDHGSPVVPNSLMIPFVAVVACCLLNGDTDLFLDSHPVQAETVLRKLLRPLCHREESVQAFIRLRGFTARWKRSHLHGICKRMDLEDDMTET